MKQSTEKICKDYLKTEKFLHDDRKIGDLELEKKNKKTKREKLQNFHRTFKKVNIQKAT